jgi:2-polyprenyl-3-methyl-5-hydroxy-6-metoxy-1,4-benzoquinol methylase
VLERHDVDTVPEKRFRALISTMAYSYDSIPVGYYDAVFHRRAGIQSKWHHDKFRRIIAEIGKTGRHLDFGCGPGTLISLLDKEVWSLGLDIAGPQIEYARQRYGGGKKKFLHQSGPQTSFPALSFDTFTCIEVIEHLPRELGLEVARESKRLLKKGGKLIITTPNYKSAWPALEWILKHKAKVTYEKQHICQYSVSTLHELLREAGFRQVEVTTFMFLSPFVAALNWQFSDSLWGVDQMVSRNLGIGLLLLAVAMP